MFTGIIEGLGTVVAGQHSDRGRRLGIMSDFILDGTKTGDSISVSGACLTVVRIEGRRFEVDVSPETLTRTTLGQIGVSERVNLERALRLSDRLDGHLVTGHVDGIGTLKKRKTEGNAILIRVKAPEKLFKYMVDKGSVALDGISLTINTCRPGELTVSVIPHTAKLTTIGFKPVGSAVNIEADILGKYVERMLPHKAATTRHAGTSGSNVDMDLLRKTGIVRS
jgi:riboflavin synthase